MRFLAGGSGRNATAAAQAVEPKSSACPRCPRSWTAAEALHENVIDLVAADLPALLAQSDGRVTVRKHLRLALAGATVERHELPLQLRLLDVLLDPNLITLLFLGGILGIAFELTHPGHRAARACSARVSLLLALLGLSIVPFSWAGDRAARRSASRYSALEAHSPAHGAFAAVGTLAVLLGGVMLFRVDNSPYGTTSFWLVLAIAGSLGLIAMFVISRIWQARRLPPRGPGVTLVGELGDRRDARCDPSGQVLVHGERWQAAAAPAAAPSPGERVRVTAQHGLVLEVEREPAAQPARDIGCRHERLAGSRRRPRHHRRPRHRHGGPRPARVRARRRSSASAACCSGPKGPGLILLVPLIDRMVKTDLRTVTLAIPPQEVITKDNVPGARDRGDVLPRRRSAGRGDADRELPRRDVADRPDDAALRARPALARRAARRARQDQRDPAGHHRHAHRALGHQDLGRRGQGRRAAHDDAARDGPPGRGRARAAREDHRRAGRVRGRRAAQQGRRPHLREPDRAAAALPADAARDLVVEQRDDDPADPDRHPAPARRRGEGDPAAASAAAAAACAGPAG